LPTQLQDFARHSGTLCSNNGYKPVLHVFFFDEVICVTDTNEINLEEATQILEEQNQIINENKNAYNVVKEETNEDFSDFEEEGDCIGKNNQYKYNCDDEVISFLFLMNPKNYC
jgi:hypothetical protein